MKIEKITIKNVRGLENHTISLGMIPNKPSILVAPNGSGKSSFAYAFQWLNRLRLKLNADDAYNNNPANKPVLIIETDEPTRNIYEANDTKNNISKRFGVFVINSGLKASSPGLHNGYMVGKSRIVVPDIELLDVKSNDKTIVDDFEVYHSLLTAQRGFIPSLTDFWRRNAVVAQLDEDALKTTKTQRQKIAAFIQELASLDGTIPHKYEVLSGKVEDVIQNKCVGHVYNIMGKIYPEDHKAKNLLRALKVVDLYIRGQHDVEQKIKYCRYVANEESIKALFHSLKDTWRGIRPISRDGKMILSIGDSQRISNGERDILILIGMLQKARQEFTKVDNILIIDEVFDYLDDANLVAAQHYINRFIDELKKHGKNIYPIMLSHINPAYYRTFAFRDMKVYYLNPLSYPTASINTMKLLRKRDELDRNPATKAQADKISKYMLHFHTNYSENLSAIIGMNDPNWGNIPVFKNYCASQLDKYLANQPYDALAVCVQLREIIERYCYGLLDEQYKDAFLEEHGTENKLAFMDERGIILPETFSLLGLIYNDSLHPNNKNQIDIRQTLYSRLENNTIKGMISEINSIVNSSNN